MTEADATRPSRATQMVEWQDSPGRRVLSALVKPVFYVVNRPALQWLGNAIFDFALGCNGFNIAYGGRHGLTASEERHLARAVAAAPPHVVFDVGANHGAYSRFLRELAPQARIYAFEPHPRTFEVLTRELEGRDVTAVNMALSDAAGEMTLFDLAGHDGSTQASLSHDAVHLFSEKVVEYPVRVSTIDAVMDEHGVERIDLLKIDTEGFDLAVLQGARRALAAGRVGMIQFEFIPANIITGSRMRDFLELLADYDVGRLCLNGQLLPIAPYSVKRAEIFASQNLIATPRRARAA